MQRLKNVLDEFLQPANAPERLAENTQPQTEKLTKLREDFSWSPSLKQNSEQAQGPAVQSISQQSR